MQKNTINDSEEKKKRLELTNDYVFKKFLQNQKIILSCRNF